MCFMSLERAIPWTFRCAQVLSPSRGRGLLVGDTAMKTMIESVNTFNNTENS